MNSQLTSLRALRQTWWLRTLALAVIVTSLGTRLPAQQSVQPPSAVASSKVPTFDAIRKQWEPRPLAELRQAAENGDAAAQYFLGFCFVKGRGVQTNQVEAASWFRKSAEQGLAVAQNELGWLYERGRGVSDGRDEAERWIRQAAEQGLAQAQLSLGWLYSNDKVKSGTVTGNYPVAAEWYEKAADQGLAEAQYLLAELYFFGKVERDYDEAAKWYRKAADQGWVDAMEKLGELYRFNHEGFKADPAEAIKWFRLAAEKGHSRAQLYLGQMMARGEGGARDDKAAVRLLTQAAEQGDSRALSKLAELSREGRGVKLGRSEQLALDQAAAGGNAPDSDFRLAQAFDRGEGVSKNDVTAAQHYFRAAHHSSGGHQTEAFDALINFLATGRATKFFTGEVLQFVERNARMAKSAPARYQLGVMFQEGRALPKDPARALDAFTQAALFGSPDAQHRIGQMWAEGLDGAPDPAEAVKWYRKAAVQGDARAQLDLAQSYLTGSGIRQNLVEAWKWMKLAAVQQLSQADAQLTGVENRMTAEQLAEAKRRQEAFVPRKDIAGEDAAAAERALRKLLPE